MYHSLIIGDKNTWVDWYLIPSSRPVISPPKLKTKIIDLPGCDGQLDLSTILTGDIAYSNRTGSIEFMVDNGTLSDYKPETWARVYSEILDYLHGRFMEVILEDDLSFYYKGRFSVNQWKSDKQNSKITIDYDLAPYKYERFGSLVDWEWDSFNFETGIIRDYRNIEVDGELDFIIHGRRMVVVPEFDVTSQNGNGLQVKFNGITHNLPDGKSRVLEISTVEGENKLTFIGNGRVSIDYRGGCL